jgi:hypothetical protein
MLFSRDERPPPQQPTSRARGSAGAVRVVLGLIAIAAVQATHATPVFAAGAAHTPGSHAYAASKQGTGMLLTLFPNGSTITEPKSPLLESEMGALTRQGFSSAGAAQAIEVQSELARTNLTDKLETVLAGAFAGLWFEPATAQLHVGVTSTASRGAAEGAAAQAGLAAAVVETPVGSTWGQLVSTQIQWNSRLAGLFAHREVKTALAPQLNAVVVTLSSSVSGAERQALEHEASTEAVKVLVAVAPSAQFNLTPSATGVCKTFAAEEAYCEKPLASGVSIESQLKTGHCTSGPIGISKKNKAITIALTAGHCAVFQGKTGVSWMAINPAGKKSVIGPMEGYLFGQGKTDYAGILVESPGNWSNGGETPVPALTAEWKLTGSTVSYPVKGERNPTVGFTNCHEGQTTGHSCGQIKAVQVSFTYGEGTNMGGMVEDKGANDQGGDSGGPWLFLEANNEALMEGIHSGGEKGNGVTTYFTPLKAALGALNLELLTTANEVR